MATNTYSRGNATLTVDRPVGSDQVALTIRRAAPLTADEVRRVNRELTDLPGANGAQLVQVSETGEWEVRAGSVLANGNGDPTADLRWVASP